MEKLTFSLDIHSHILRLANMAECTLTHEDLDVEITYLKSIYKKTPTHTLTALYYKMNKFRLERRKVLLYKMFMQKFNHI